MLLHRQHFCTLPLVPEMRLVGRHLFTRSLTRTPAPATGRGNALHDILWLVAYGKFASYKNYLGMENDEQPSLCIACLHFMLSKTLCSKNGYTSMFVLPVEISPLGQKLRKLLARALSLLEKPTSIFSAGF